MLKLSLDLFRVGDNCEQILISEGFMLFLLFLNDLHLEDLTPLP